MLLYFLPLRNRASELFDSLAPEPFTYLGQALLLSPEIYDFVSQKKSVHHPPYFSSSIVLILCRKNETLSVQSCFFEVVVFEDLGRNSREQRSLGSPS